MQKDANGPIGGREHLTFHESPPILFECMRKNELHVRPLKPKARFDEGATIGVLTTGC